MALAPSAMPCAFSLLKISLEALTRLVPASCWCWSRWKRRRYALYGCGHCYTHLFLKVFFLVIPLVVNWVTCVNWANSNSFSRFRGFGPVLAFAQKQQTSQQPSQVDVPTAPATDACSAYTAEPCAWTNAAYMVNAVANLLQSIQTKEDATTFEAKFRQLTKPFVISGGFYVRLCSSDASTCLVSGGASDDSSLQSWTEFYKDSTANAPIAVAAAMHTNALPSFMQAQILHAVNTTSRGRGRWVEAVYAECQVLRTKLSEKSVKQEAFVLTPCLTTHAVEAQRVVFEPRFAVSTFLNVRRVPPPAVSIFQQLIPPNKTQNHDEGFIIASGILNSVPEPILPCNSAEASGCARHNVNVLMGRVSSTARSCTNEQCVHKLLQDITFDTQKYRVSNRDLGQGEAFFYVFAIREDGTFLAHGANPALVGMTLEGVGEHGKRAAVSISAASLKNGGYGAVATYDWPVSRCQALADEREEGSSDGSGFPLMSFCPPVQKVAVTIRVEHMSGTIAYGAGYNHARPTYPPIDSMNKTLSECSTLYALPCAEQEVKMLVNYAISAITIHADEPSIPLDAITSQNADYMQGGAYLFAFIASTGEFVAHGRFPDWVKNQESLVDLADLLGLGSDIVRGDLLLESARQAASAGGGWVSYNFISRGGEVIDKLAYFIELNLHNLPQFNGKDETVIIASGYDAVWYPYDNGNSAAKDCLNLFNTECSRSRAISLVGYTTAQIEIGIFSAAGGLNLDVQLDTAFAKIQKSVGDVRQDANQSPPVFAFQRSSGILMGSAFAMTNNGTSWNEVYVNRTFGYIMEQEGRFVDSDAFFDKLVQMSVGGGGWVSTDPYRIDLEELAKASFRQRVNRLFYVSGMICAQAFQLADSIDSCGFVVSEIMDSSIIASCSPGQVLLHSPDECIDVPMGFVLVPDDEGRVLRPPVLKRCERGMYNLVPGNGDEEFYNGTCLPCPSGATCDGGFLISHPAAKHNKTWIVNPGYWGSPSIQSCEPNDATCVLTGIYACDSAVACPGGPGVAKCAAEYDSDAPLCGACLKGFDFDVNNPGTCQECPSARVIKTTVGGGFAVYALMWYIIYRFLCFFAVERKPASDEKGMQGAGEEMDESALQTQLNNLYYKYYYTASNVAYTAGALSNILTGYIQVFGQMRDLYTFKAPGFLSEFFEVLNGFVNPFGAITRSKCVFDQLISGDSGFDPYIAEIAVSALIPFAIVITFATVYHAVVFWNRERVMLTVLRSGCMKFLLFFINYFHPSISATMFKLFRCDKIRSDSITSPLSVMRASRPVLCSLDHSHYNALAIVVGIYTVLFVFGYPLIFFFCLRRWKRTVLRDDEGRMIIKEVLFRTRRATDKTGRLAVFKVKRPMNMLDTEYVNSLCGIFYEVYEIHFFYWQVYEIFRRLASTGGVIMVAVVSQGVDGEEGISILYGLVIAVWSLAFHCMHMPYRDSRWDWLWMTIHLNQVVAMLCISSFATETTSTLPVIPAAIMLSMTLLIFVMIVYVCFFWVDPYKNAGEDEESDTAMDLVTNDEYDDKITQEQSENEDIPSDEFTVLVDELRAARDWRTLRHHVGISNILNRNRSQSRNTDEVAVPIDRSSNGSMDHNPEDIDRVRRIIDNMDEAAKFLPTPGKPQPPPAPVGLPPLLPYQVGVHPILPLELNGEDLDNDVDNMATTTDDDEDY